MLDKSLNLSVEGTSVASRQARMRLSDQMKRILLVLLKAREDPEWALAKAGFMPHECPEHFRKILLEGRAGGWLSMKEVDRFEPTNYFIQGLQDFWRERQAHRI